MPNYDYRCTKCGHEYELFQTMSAKPKTKCPECGKKVQRLMGSGAGVMFKGTGFYETDYKKSSGGPSKSASDKGGDSKPASDKGGTSKPS